MEGKAFERNYFLKPYDIKDFIFKLFSLSLLNVFHVVSDTHRGMCNTVMQSVFYSLVQFSLQMSVRHLSH